MKNRKKFIWTEIKDAYPKLVILFIFYHLYPMKFALIQLIDGDFRENNENMLT